MSFWTTKAFSNGSRNYIVVRHPLKGVNYSINGVKFRDGFAVVEKGSKFHYMLKKVPLFKNMKELPLTHLRNLAFITRTKDVKMVFGQDVYVKFLKDEQKVLEEKEEIFNVIEETKKVEEEKVHLEESINCNYRTVQGSLCKHEMLSCSPSGYCSKHILLDPKLIDFGIEVPQFIPKENKKRIRRKVINKLKFLKKEDKLDGKV